MQGRVKSDREDQLRTGKEPRGGRVDKMGSWADMW